jgi:hypothetical protein
MFFTMVLYTIGMNLKPTVRFYEGCVGVEAAAGCILAGPSILLDASLSGRLRLVEARQLDIVAYAIARMAKYTELAWKEEYGKACQAAAKTGS